MTVVHVTKEGTGVEVTVSDAGHDAVFESTHPVRRGGGGGKEGGKW